MYVFEVKTSFLPDGAFLKRKKRGGKYKRTATRIVSAVVQRDKGETNYHRVQYWSIAFIMCMSMFVVTCDSILVLLPQLHRTENTKNYKPQQMIITSNKKSECT